MDKNAIRKYAVWARRELIARVSQKAAQYEITADGYGSRDAGSVNGRILSRVESAQRTALIDQIDMKGYEQVMEEAAYTWFNRFSALRFMEVNGCLPSYVRVFTDEENNFRPQILTEAINLDLDGLDMQKVYDLKNANDDDELFKYLIITQCNDLSSILPGMFQKIDDYTELLFPDNLLREGSVIEQMITLIPEEDWKDQVQIIGWLYQYYNTEPKDKVFADLKKNIKISKESIPAATQLFTPDWIVRYMVENSLGRLWVEGHPAAEQFLPEHNDDGSVRVEEGKWNYYLEEAEQEPEVQAQLEEIRKEYAALRPEDILCIDPCQGSGHILTYMFDVLVQIYESYGYSAREAATSIVKNNLWGLDIDDRASQLAYFSVMMKARQYDHRFFKRGIQPHVYSIAESNNLDPHCIAYFISGRPELRAAMDSIIEELHDAKEYGSIINVTSVDFEALYARCDEIEREMSIYTDEVLGTILPLIQVAQALAQKYHVVVTNPPYMGGSGMGAKLLEHVRRYYADSKSDLFAVFIERCEQMVALHGYQAMITQHSWMFLTSFEKLRMKLQEVNTSSMIHLGARAFEEIGGEVVQTTAFAFRHTHIPEYKGIFVRLIDPNTQHGKEVIFLSGTNRFVAQQDNFIKIPGAPVAYWVSDTFKNVFKNTLGDVCEVKKGSDTGENDRYVRLWHEVDKHSINFAGRGKKWVIYLKGGEARKWYGHLNFVVNWENNGKEIRQDSRSTIRNEKFFYRDGITWSDVGTNGSTFRYFPKDCLRDNRGPAIFTDNILYILGLLNTNLCLEAQKIVNPTICFQAGSAKAIPYIYDENASVSIARFVKSCISISKSDWDAFETSWDFQRHPLVRPVPSDPEERTWVNSSGDAHVDCPMEYAYTLWMLECDGRFNQLKANEEELNRIFIDIYGLQDELSPEVEDKDVTVRRADLKRDIRSFISYAAGCMFGRYSLDVPGLAYAGGDWDGSKYQSFIPDSDAILPICDDEYFEDDIVGRFIKFVEAVYGEDTLEENLRFIADALGGDGTSREVIRKYFINDFYADHCKVYQKRPIYWLFDSGRKNGFKCLVYMHRYRPDTIARIRTDYVHEQQSRYRTAITDLENRIDAAGTGERVKLTRQLNRIQDQAEELRVYEEKIHHLADQMISIDLDDGVKHNYAIFQDVLARIK